MKKLIIVCGSPASGKSSYAAKLGSHISATVLDIDTCTERIVRVALKETGKDPNDRDSLYFKEKYRIPIYETLFAIARDNLAHSDVIVIGPFTKEIRDPEWPTTIANTLGVKPEIHYLRCDPIKRKERMSLRSQPRDQSKIQDWTGSQEYYGKEEIPAFEHVLIDTTNLVD